MADPLPRPPRRWFRKFLLALALLFAGLAALLWFAPMLVANSSYKDSLIADATRDLNGKLTVKSLKLGWLSQVELIGVTLADADGKPAVEIERIVVGKTLYDLMRNRDDLGTITIEKPVVHLHCEPGKTNLETILAHYLKPSDKPATKRPTLRIVIANGTVKFSEVGIAVAEELIGVGGTVDIPSDPAAAIEIALQLHNESDRNLSIAASVSPESNKATVTAVRFPLAKLGPALRRFVSGWSVLGEVNGTVSAESGGADFTASGSAIVNTMDATGPVFQGDRLRLKELSLAPFKIESKAGVVRTEGIDLTCDVGHLLLSGSGTTGDDAEALLGRAGLKLTVDVDVAKLAAMLPKLMRLRDGVALTQGRLGVGLQSTAVGNETAWVGTVTTSDLRGVHDGKPLSWDTPLSVAFEAKLDAKRMPRFDKLEARSDFFALAGRGKLESFIVLVNVNLDRLNAKLADFINLDGLRFGGAAEISVKNDLAADGRFQAVGTAKLTNAFLQDAQGRRLAEALFNIDLQAGGVRSADGAIKVETATATLAGGEDRLTAVLREPIADARNARTGAADVALHGELSRWLGRVRPWVPLPPDFTLAGRGPVNCSVKLTEAGAEFREARALLEQVRMTGYGLDVDEPKLKVEAAGTWERATGAVALGNVVVHGDTLVFTSTATTMTTAPSFGVKTAGNLTANLNRVQRMLKLQSDPKNGDAINGLAVGPLKLDYAGNAIVVETDLKIDGLMIGSPADPIWKEPKVMFALRGRYDLAGDALSIAELRTERDGLNLSAAGDVAAVTTTQDAKITGTIAYDLAKLEPQLKSMLGAGTKASGNGTRPFAVSGRLADAPASLTANAGLAWQRLFLSGFDIGQAELNAAMTKGLLTTNMVEATFASGKVRIEPTVDFAKAGMPLSLKPGRLVEKAKLTPAATADALGFVLPALANSAQVDGTFSFDLDQNSIPLAAPKTGTMKGKLLIHEANASASPMLAELIQLFGGNNTSAVLAKEQTVLVRFENGRVYHEGLKLKLGQSEMSMSGSVGLDRTLAMTIDMPVPPKLLGALVGSNAKLRDSIGKQRLSIPVGGTLAKPALDLKKAETGIQTLIAGAGKDLLNDAAGDLFKKMLEKKKP